MNRTNPSPGASRDFQGHGLAEVERTPPPRTDLNGARISSPYFIHSISSQMKTTNEVSWSEVPIIRNVFFHSNSQDLSLNSNRGKLVPHVRYQPQYFPLHLVHNEGMHYSVEQLIHFFLWNNEWQNNSEKMSLTWKGWIACPWRIEK